MRQYSVSEQLPGGRALNVVSCSKLRTHNLLLAANAHFRVPGPPDSVVQKAIFIVGTVTNRTAIDYFVV
uniref:Uncharacterized protein n=1 Tax=Romanomermis culicivorax TaxID=13658 RepID=A0A915HRV2_ROMCU